MDIEELRKITSDAKEKKIYGPNIIIIDGEEHYLDDEEDILEQIEIEKEKKRNGIEKFKKIIHDRIMDTYNNELTKFTKLGCNHCKVNLKVREYPNIFQDFSGKTFDKYVIPVINELNNKKITGNIPIKYKYEKCKYRIHHHNYHHNLYIYFEW